MITDVPHAGMSKKMMTTSFNVIEEEGYERKSSNKLIYCEKHS